jgi:hypothetical protein
MLTVSTRKGYYPTSVNRGRPNRPIYQYIFEKGKATEPKSIPADDLKALGRCCLLTACRIFGRNIDAGH